MRARLREQWTEQELAALQALLWNCPRCGRTDPRAGATWGCSLCYHRVVAPRGSDKERT